VGQRLQRQGHAWETELDAWIQYRKRDPVEEARAILGCRILIAFCDLLHAQMFQSNSESLAIRNRSRTVPFRNGIDCSLLLSVTDGGLPAQHGSTGLRYCFPDHLQLQQPQTEEDITTWAAAASPSLPKSAALETLLEENSFDALKRKCAELQIPGKLNRLRMAERILFHEPADQPRQSPAPEGKVLCFMVCRVVTQC
jgi:hypothetical protein